jgi:signal transduction histidine kinase
MDTLSDSLGRGFFSYFSVSFFLLSTTFCLSVILFIFYWQTHKTLLSTAAKLKIAHKKLQIQEFNTRLLVSSQMPILVLIWDMHETEIPHVIGDPELFTLQNGDILEFNTWLSPLHAPLLKDECVTLRERGKSFSRAVRTQKGMDVHVHGFYESGLTGVCFQMLVSPSHAAVQEHIAQSSEDRRGIFLELLNLIPHPLWVRTKKGQLTWVNKAYLHAVDCSDMTIALLRQTELLDSEASKGLAASRARDESCNVCAASVIQGERRVFHVMETSTPGGFFGIATDISRLEEASSELMQVINAHRHTLDKISTAVAIFNGNQRLVFYNNAYQSLWKFDSSFLDSHPTDSETLENLRARNSLPEQNNFRSWQKEMLSIYTDIAPRESWWHLPDGRTIRILATPVLRGGVTYIFDDVSELFLLESKYNRLTRVQRETLDSLQEGVAVFGSDGRLALFNPSFMRIWSLDSETLEAQPHVDLILELCRASIVDGTPLLEVHNAVVGLNDKRESSLFRVHHIDGLVLDGSVAPLPDGSTLVTFTDVSASVHMEKALTERNEALQHAARLRDNFVHHVSYELRSPLTTIIGFIQLLKEGKITNLTRKQRDYIDHISRSSSSLLVIMNDILDLATIEKGTVELDCTPVDLKETIYAALRGLEDRLAESKAEVLVDIDAEIGHFIADGKRLRQIIFNLLSNAINLSQGEQRIRISAYEVGSEIVLSVADEGHPITPELQNAMTRQLEGDTSDLSHPGIGLGLSIVRSFVALHGGRVALTHHPEGGTVITCRFPAQNAPDITSSERHIA